MQRGIQCWARQHGDTKRPSSLAAIRDMAALRDNPHVSVCHISSIFSGFASIHGALYHSVFCIFCIAKITCQSNISVISVTSFSLGLLYCVLEFLWVTLFSLSVHPWWLVLLVHV